MLQYNKIMSNSVLTVYSCQVCTYVLGVYTRDLTADTDKYQVSLECIMVYMYRYCFVLFVSDLFDTLRRLRVPLPHADKQ